MLSLRRSSLLIFALLFTIFIAACSNPLSGSTTSSNTTTTTTTKNNTTTTKNSAATTGYGKTTGKTTTTPMAKPTATAQASASMGGSTMGGSTMGANALIHTTQVMLNGKEITVLTNAKGMILYYKLDDPRPASACTGGCATAWPPVLATGMNTSMMVTSSIQLPHKLTVYKTANGNQVEYDNHPLYTYAGDMTPGQFTGRGMGNVWYLVSLGL